MALKKPRAVSLPRKEMSRNAAIHGGNVRHVMPFGNILWRMAGKVVSEKVVRKVKKGWGRDKSKLTKLTDEQVREIRAKYVPHKVTARILAIEYGVTEGNIAGIVEGRLRPFA